MKQTHTKKNQDGLQACDDTNYCNERKKDRDTAKITRLEMFIFKWSVLHDPFGGRI